MPTSAGTTLLRRSLTAGAVLLVIWAVVVLAAARSYVPASPDAPSATSRAAVPQDWMVVQGSGHASDQGLVVDRLAPDGATLLVWQPEPFDAAALPVLQMDLDGVPFNYVMMLAWTVEGAPEPSFARLQIPTGSTRTIHLARFKHWRGRVVEIAVYLYPQQQTSPPAELAEPILVDDFGFFPDSTGRRVAALVDAWFAAMPWELMTISSVGVYRDLQTTTHLLAVTAVFWLTAMLAVGLVFRFTSLRQWVATVAVGTVVATVVLNVHWLWSFAHQRAATNAIYAGLEPAAKQDRLFDADLVQIVRKAKAHLPEPGSARIFVGADDRFFRLRAAWHLRPHNVFSFLPGVDIRGAGQVRKGDYVFLYRTPELIGQGVSERRMTLAKRELPVRVVFREGDGALLRVGGRSRE